MPTKRRRIPHSQAAQVSPAVLSILSENLWPMPPESEHEAVRWKYFLTDQQRKRVLDQCRAPILAEWIRQRPGTRPDFWWRSAPEKCRRRLGGIGAAAHDVFPAYLPVFSHGVPVVFDEVDPRDPPRFESQAAYLRRHRLLTREESRRLKKKDFNPETVEETR